MLVVGADATAQERALASGRLRCPACRGSLAPWGSARPRRVRLRGVPDALVRPRRARCRGCRATHVLLPDWMLLRRAYAAPVVWEVLVDHVGGLGYRRIALARGLPAGTVRDWLRAFRRPTPGPGHRLVTWLHAQVPATRAWRIAVRLTRARLPANTSPPHDPGAIASGLPP